MKGYQKKKVSANNVAPGPCHVTTAAGTEVGQGRTSRRSAPRAPALGHPYMEPHPPPHPPPPGRGGGLCLPPLLGEPQPRPLLWVSLCLCTGNSSWAPLLEPRGRAAQADPNGRLHE